MDLFLARVIHFSKFNMKSRIREIEDVTLKLIFARASKSLLLCSR